ncbi:MAG: hypothetical protein WCO28_05270 [Bacteroidota bacterium]
MKNKYLNTLATKGILLASIITFSIFLNNCNSEKRFGFREKIRVNHNSNSAKVIQKIQAKPITVLATSNENIIAPILKKEIVFTKNIETKITSLKQTSPFDNVSASVNNSKPDIIKKLPLIEEENKYVKPKAQNKNPSKSLLVGIILLVIGVLGLILSFTVLKDNIFSAQTAQNGCNDIIEYFAAIAVSCTLGIVGLVLTIVGLINN